MSLLIVSAAVIVSSFLGYYSGRHLPPSSTSPAFIVNQPTHTLTPVPSLSPLPSPTPTPTIAPTLKPLPTITPTPLPIPTPIPTPLSTQADLYGLTEHYASQYHVDAGALRHIAECESGFNPSATHLDYAGLYQFSPDSWTKYRTQMDEDPHPDLRLSPDAATKTAAYILSLGHSSIWPTCAGSSL